MTINATGTKITYRGDGATTTFSFNFAGGPNPDIHVYLTDVATGEVIEVLNFSLVLNAPLGPNPTSVGGVVTYPSLILNPPITAGTDITIVRQAPLSQPTSLTNQSILYQEVIEKGLDYLGMEIQQLEEQLDRGLTVPINEVGPMIIPGIPFRANKFLSFDENGNPTATTGAQVLTPTNALRVPTNESINPLPQRVLRPGRIISFDGAGEPILIDVPPPNVPPLLGGRQVFSAATIVGNSQKGFLLELGGATFYPIIFGDFAVFDNDFSVAIYNADQYTGPGTGRAKLIQFVDGFTGTPPFQFYLWPGQWVYVFRAALSWQINPIDARWKPGLSPTFFVDPVNGSDNPFEADGLAPGVGAFLTVDKAVAVASAQVDYGTQSDVGGAIIQLAPGDYLPESLMLNFSTVGGFPMTIKGADDGVDPTPWNFVVNNDTTGIHIDAASTVILKGLHFFGLGDNCTGIIVSRGSVGFVSNCTFAIMAGANATHIRCFDSSIVNIRDCIIIGSTAAWLRVARNSTAILSGAITFGASLNFTDACVVAEYQSAVLGGPGLFGTPGDLVMNPGFGNTGRRFRVQYNSTGRLGTGVMQALPGNLAGITGGTAPVSGTDASNVY